MGENFLPHVTKSYFQEQIGNVEVAVHAGDHDGGAEVPLHAVHVHLRPWRQLGHDVQVSHAGGQDQGCEAILVGLVHLIRFNG